ncbi:MAG: hypothetical protein ABF636_13200 [Acetobacter sp.]
MGQTAALPAPTGRHNWPPRRSTGWLARRLTGVPNMETSVTVSKVANWGAVGR